MKKRPIVYPESSNPKIPQPMKEFYHKLPLQMRFNDIDMVGHLNNAVYIQFFDLGKVDYFQTVMSNGVNWHHIPVVVVNINCNYYAPTFLDEPIEVVTSVYGISQRSLKMEQRIINSVTGEIKCVALTVMAGFDPATNSGVPLDTEWAAAIEAYESNRE